MSINEIFGQDKAISILQRAFTSDKMPHAYIFAGPEGVGKFKTAREWAKLLLCEKSISEKARKLKLVDSCGTCKSCRLFDADSHPDFNHVYKELREFTEDGKDKVTPVDLSIDVIREFLIAKAATRPTLSARKVFVVSEAEKLNTASQNALLKVLEEPPSYCSIILLCTRLEKLLPTTRSRCQVVRFIPINEEKIVDKLKEMDIDAKKAQYFARLSQGSLGVARLWAQLELADTNLFSMKKELVNSLSILEYANALDLAQWLLDESKKIAAAWFSLNEAASKTDVNRRAAKTIIQIIVSALQDAMKLKLTDPAKIINFDQKEQIEKLASRFSFELSSEKIADCYETLRWIDYSVNEKLIFERLLLNLAVSDKMNVL